MAEKERSVTYEPDDSIAGEIFNDGKGEVKEIHETDPETGRTETYEPDNSVAGQIFNDGKGELKEITEKDDAA